jgi:hypothetical protein
LLADGFDFVESERRIEPKDLTPKVQASDSQIHLLIQACEDWRKGWWMKLKIYGPEGYLVSIDFQIVVG